MNTVDVCRRVRLPRRLTHSVMLRDLLSPYAGRRHGPSGLLDTTNRVYIVPRSYNCLTKSSAHGVSRLSRCDQTGANGIDHRRTVRIDMTALQ